MFSVNNDQTLALAGIFQSAQLVQQLATRGQVEPTPYLASVSSILTLEADSVEDVFGNNAGVRLGLDLLTKMLNKEISQGKMEISRYVISLIQLAKNLSKNPVILKALFEMLSELNQQWQVPEGQQIDPGWIELAANGYKDTISLLQPQIIVNGEHGYLAKQEIVNQVRTGLLAGVRAAYLWLQIGGSRWQMLFARNQYRECIESLLSKDRSVIH